MESNREGRRTSVVKQGLIAALIAILPIGALLAALASLPHVAEHAHGAAHGLLRSLYAKVEWLFSKSIDNIVENFVELCTAPFSFGDRLHWVNLLGFCVFAAIAVAVHYRGTPRMGVRGFVKFLFPVEYYKHPSALIDYQVYLVNRIFTPVRPLTRALSDAAIAGVVISALSACFGPPLGAALPGIVGIVLYTLLVVTVGDFVGWLGHAILHRVPALWEFHKLHHSAEVLIPLTYYRIHPVEEIVGTILSVLINGTFSGVIAFVLLEQPSLLTIFGVSAVIAVFQAAGSNLRHSHIWLSWGPVLSRILISPAQHQIHHSVDPRHYGKNYGSIFAIWDWMFGTLYVPKEKEQLTFGLATPQIHPTLWAAYVVPFKSARQVFVRSLRAKRVQPVALPVAATGDAGFNDRTA